MIVHEVNWDEIHEEAERVREQEDQKGPLRDIERYEWKDENIHRLLPPYSAKGIFFRKFGTHFQIKPDNEVRDCLLTWPDVFDRCPICDAIDRILKKLPNLNLGRQETSWAYYANIIDRDEEDKGPQIVRYTPGVRNWFVLQFDNRKVGDLSDIERGFDVTITRKEKRGKGKNKKRTFIDYKPDRDPDRSPLHESDEMIAKWMGEIFDLDKIVSPPDDDKLAEIRSMAKQMERYYLRKHEDEHDDRSERRSSRRDEDDDDDRRERRTRRRDEDDDDRSERRRRRDEDEEDRDVKKPSDDEKHERRARASKADDIGDVKPTDLPACHAALDDPETHNDGSVGFNHELEKCLLCDEELSCSNAKQQKGK